MDVYAKKTTEKICQLEGVDWLDGWMSKAYRTSGFEVKGQRRGHGSSSGRGRHFGDWSKCIGTEGTDNDGSLYGGEDVGSWFGYLKDPVHEKSD